MHNKVCLHVYLYIDLSISHLVQTGQAAEVDDDDDDDASVPMAASYVGSSVS